MSASPVQLDVLCIGHASYDLVFSVNSHPGPDEKTVADKLLGCGGGPAANAAVMVSRLGCKAGFAGYLGNDSFGTSHLQELQHYNVDTRLVVRGPAATPLSTVLVKPDGKRSLINYKEVIALSPDCLDFTQVQAKVILCDGHEGPLSLTLLNSPAQQNTPSVLDAGSLHEGTRLLMERVDYLVCSEKFACQYSGTVDLALTELAGLSPVVVITLGEHGLIWRRGAEQGKLAAPPVTAVDSTGAGDAFHGAFAAGLAAELAWPELLRYASAAGGLCCQQLGARTGLPDQTQVLNLLRQWVL